jgi:hypothetical protein
MKLKAAIKNIFNSNENKKKPQKSSVYYLTAKKNNFACEQYILTTKRYAAEEDPSSITNFYTDVNLNHLYDPEDGYYGWNTTYNANPIYTGYICDGEVTNIQSCLTTTTTTLAPTTTTTLSPTTTTTLPTTTIKPKDRVLFILKDRVYQKVYSQSYGLYNSAKMVMNYLESTGNVCDIVTVIDANFIDAEVYKFKPTVVIIEALWITGAKMKELSEIPRYKNIKWVIRIHSDIGFLAAEARAFKYIHEYIDLNNENVIVSCNNREFNEELSKVCNYNFKYLPNIFDFEEHEEENVNKSAIEELNEQLKTTMIPIKHKNDKKIIKIASFGALRVLKNQMFQAMCAINAADKMNMILHFHVNGDIQNPYNPVLSNLKEMFDLNGKHQLIVHGWLEHKEFDKLIQTMDIGLQVSYTESFNIVAADFVFNNVPIIVSDSIDWMPKIEMVSTTKYDDVTKKIIEIYHYRKNTLLLRLNRMHLMMYNSSAKWIWNRYIK